MDILYFLKQRTALLSRHHNAVVTLFEDRQKAIRERQPPFDGYPVNYQDEEPPFVEEWCQAADSIDFEGLQCLSSLSASLKLFLESAESAIRNLRHAPELDKAAFRHGFFPGYQAWFKSIGINFADSAADLDLIGEMPIIRNLNEHPNYLPMIVPTLDKKHRQKIPAPIFIRDHDRVLVEQSGGMFEPVIHVSRESLSRAIEALETLCDFIESKIFHRPTDIAE